MDRTRSEMIGMTSRKFPGVRNTSYYGVQVVHCVRRSREYRKSSKMTKYALRAVACVSTLSFIGFGPQPPSRLMFANVELFLFSPNYIPTLAHFYRLFCSISICNNNINIFFWTLNNLKVENMSHD